MLLLVTTVATDRGTLTGCVFLKIIRLLFPFVASAFVAAWTLVLTGFILALFRNTGPPIIWLPFPLFPLVPFFEVVGAEFPFGAVSFPLEFDPCLSPQELQSISPWGVFLHKVEVVTLQELHTGFIPNGILFFRFWRNSAKTPEQEIKTNLVVKQWIVTKFLIGQI